MTELATLPEVKSALRVDGNDYDDTMRIMIAAASRAVLRYVKTDMDTLLIGDSGEPLDLEANLDVDRMRWAIIMLVGYWLRNPDADPDADFDRGYLPKPVTALLYDMRDPTLA